MKEWFNLYTFIAFLLGVFMAASVKGLFAQAKTKLGK